jgi:secondary thiamine-phosphate synthase enzyme
MSQAAAREWTGGGVGCHHEEKDVDTPPGVAFVDLTPWVLQAVERSGVLDGLVTVQSTHTTASIVVNEAEPLLLEDLRDALERFAPRQAAYRHDDFSVRTVNVEPGEPANGHSHCKALLLRASETLTVRAGRPRLGRWQRVFLVELDGARRRRVALSVLGAAK